MTTLPSISLTAQAFEPGALLTTFCAGRDETGAVASFVGLARAERGQATILELEAYPGFTDAAIAALAEDAKARFDLHDYRIVHRIGRIAPGEAIVFVATAASHRRAAFEACDFLMDYLKSRAPFWKKQHGPDGERWIEPTARDRTDAERWD
ncbi:MAG: molybdenum cofactor biosynthesis protein MoaE [Caulobacter sp.]|nr:molybdenum cofactor biosynthesis protein MoaE [Caulobacter sp.]